MIVIDHVSRRFGDSLAVDDVSLTVARGTITTLVGTSGSGKSTLLRMINRLIEPTAGTIRIDGQDTAGLSGEVLRRGIGYVIQGHGLFPHWTVARNVATVPQLLGWDRVRIDRRVRELLTMLQLDPDTYAGKYPHQLSGGQQQRVGVARAIAAEPRLLLMDEPFGALDPVIRAQAQADLVALQKRVGITVVLVTHDVEEAIHLGDRVAVMDKGRLLQVAAPADILAHPQPGLVERLVGTDERALRILSLGTVAEIAEPGSATGRAVPAGASLRTALSDLLWQKADSLPVTAADGTPQGRITLRSILARAGGAALSPGAWAARFVALLLLVTLVFTPELYAPVFRPLTENGAPPIYTQASLSSLALAHLALVFAASLVSAVLAVSLGIFVTRPRNAEFLPLSRTVVNIGQVFPPVAVLAIAVPLVGFGTTPTLIALVLYGLLPIFESTVAGLTGVPAAVSEAARGMGLSARRRLLAVELPLALPVILGGLRLSVVINLGTATIGSTVAAKGLGEVIIAGLQSSNTAFILQGGLVVALLAVLIYDGFGLVEQALSPGRGP